MTALAPAVSPIRPPLVLAIDPGPLESGWLLYDAAAPRIVDFGKDPNDDIAARIRVGAGYADVVVIEKVRSYGMAVGAEVFETVFWSGRFAEAAAPTRVERLERKAVARHICGSDRAKDANVRQALLDHFGGSTAKGTKNAPGPLYGISGDVWSALAIAVTFADQEVARLSRGVGELVR